MHHRVILIVLLAAAALAVSGCAGRAAQAPTPATQPAKTPQQLADEMDAMHEAGVKAFPAKTEGQGNQVLRPEIRGGVKVFRITARVVQWEVTAGVRKEAWAYNGTVPGPQIRVTEGDRVRIEFQNDLPESTSIHFHGLVVPNAMDGVPFITQPVVKSGARFTYEFVAKPAGTHMYHSHHAADTQVPMGLLGAFIIEPKNRAAEPKVSQDVIMVLNDGPLGFTINGKGFPATQPIVARLGDRIRVRFMNEGMAIHPMHLHGMAMRVIAEDGYPLPQPYTVDTLLVAPGQRFDVIVTADNPGVWAFHCHVLSHAESRQGMFGMVTALIVK